jgi:hypothetical protein
MSLLKVTPTEMMMQITKVPAGIRIRQLAGISYVVYSIEVNATGYYPVIVRDTDGHAHYFRPDARVIVPVGTVSLDDCQDHDDEHGCCDSCGKWADR